MSDLISRQAAIDAIEITPFDDYGDYMRTRELIEQLSSAQPEIIRCKDCKHYADDQCDRYADETLGYVHSTQADGYCWVAERKEK